MNILRNQKDLEELLGFAMVPLDPQSLGAMLEACNLLLILDSTDRARVFDLMKAIDKVGDRDDRDLLRRKAAMTLAKLQAWDTALAIAEQVELEVERLDTLMLITIKMIGANKQLEALSILDQIEVVASETSNSSMSQWQKARFLDEVALMFFREGHKRKALGAWNKAIAAVRTGPIGEDENIALQEVVRSLASAGYLDVAEQAAEMISLSGRKAVANAFIAEAKRRRQVG